jgi:hypothetical protein
MAENGTVRPYLSLCDMFCHDTNRQLLTAIQLLVNEANYNPNYEFTYPMARLLNRDVYLGYT